MSEISLVTDEILWNQAGYSSNLNQRIDEKWKPMSSALDNIEETTKTLQAQFNGLLKLRSSPRHPHDQHSNMLSTLFLTIRTSLPRNKLAYCNTGCCCNCHRICSLQSPSFLDRLLGKLSVDYSGCLAGLVPPCSDASCLSMLSSSTQFIYVFPSWLCSKVLELSLQTSPLGDPSLTLAVYRSVPTGSKVFWLTACNDVDGLRSLFNGGLASPKDIDNQYGYTVLQVGFFHFSSTPFASKRQALAYERTLLIETSPTKA